MKPEEKKRLKQFWLGKGLLFIGIIGSITLMGLIAQLLNLHVAIFKETDVKKEIKAFPAKLLAELDGADVDRAKGLIHFKDANRFVFFSKRNDVSKQSDALQNFVTQLLDKKSVSLCFVTYLKNPRTGCADRRRRDYWLSTSTVEAVKQLGGKRSIALLLSTMQSEGLGRRIEAYILLKELHKPGQLTSLSRFEVSFLLIFYSILLLATLIIGSLAVFLFMSFSSPYPLSWSGHLLLPEETIAELIALKRRRQKQNVPQWKLNLELTTEVLFLLWAIHIQVRLQNLSLPPSKKRNIE